MSKVVFLINMTPDGRCGHEAVVADDELHAHATETLRSADAVLFGRATFQLLAGHWPEVAAKQSGTAAENEFARTIGSLPKVVFSKTIGPVAWNARVVRTDAADEVRRLKAQPGRNLVIQASPGLAASLRAADLIDEYRLLVQPILAGTGPLLFPSNEPELKLTLTSTRPFRSGVVELRYERR